MTEIERLQAEIQELRRLLDLPTLEEQIKQYSEETQLLINRIWKLYHKTCSSVSTGGREKLMLDTSERFSTVYFERFLQSLKRYPESILQSGLRAYLSSEWVGSLGSSKK